MERVLLEAARTLQQRRQEATDFARAETGGMARELPIPRWIVVLGLLFYCTVAWVIIGAIGKWAFDLLRVAAAAV